MIPVLLAVTAVISYYLGSISTINLTSNLRFHCNIAALYPRDNDGITRFYKTYGIKGVLVLFLTEAVKTLIPVLLGGLLMGFADHADIGRAFALFCVMLGTVFPIMYDFKGETSFVAFCVCIPFVSMGIGFVMLIVFAAVYYFSRYISLSVVSAALAMCFASVIMVDTAIVRQILLFIAVLIVIEYRKSLTRLIRGEEDQYIYKKDLSYMFDRAEYGDQESVESKKTERKKKRS